MATLYVLKDGPFIKIGVGGAGQRRRAQCQTGNPRRISLLHEFSFPDKAAAFKKESEFKKKWMPWRAGGGSEWFRLPPGELELSIPSLAFTPPEVITPGEQLLNGRISHGFALVEQKLRDLRRVVTIKPDQVGVVRGILLDAVFLASDNTHELISQFIPEAGAALDRELAVTRSAIGVSPRFAQLREHDLVKER